MAKAASERSSDVSIAAGVPCFAACVRLHLKGEVQTCGKNWEDDSAVAGGALFVCAINPLGARRLLGTLSRSRRSHAPPSAATDACRTPGGHQVTQLPGADPEELACLVSGLFRSPK